MPDSRFFTTRDPMPAAEAAEAAGAMLIRDGARLVRRAAGLADDDLSDAVVFAESKSRMAALKGRAVALCIAPPDCRDGGGFDGALAAHAEPKLAFALVAARLHEVRLPALSDGVHPSAKIGEGARIHPAAVIAEDAVIGPRAIIGPHAYIGPGAVIGADSEIGASASIICALIGERAMILAGARIGEAGFGFARGPLGHVRLPQLGRVIIGNDVEIGANSTVDRGALGDTVIEDGVKIDNLVQIGHNVRIGRNSALAAQAGVSGSTILGEGVLVGGQAGLVSHLEIGDGARILGQAGVMRNVPAKKDWGGTPARPAKAWFRETAALAKLARRKKAEGDDDD